MNEFLATTPISSSLIWSLTFVLLVTGIIGCILPILPGHILIFLTILTNRWILGEAATGITWTFIILIGITFTIAQITEFLMSSAGSKWSGGSRWGALGALIGTIIGLFFFPLGLLLGPLLGAFLGELLFTKGTLHQATKSGLGSMLGNVLAITLKLTLALIVVGIYLTITFSHLN